MPNPNNEKRRNSGLMLALITAFSLNLAGCSAASDWFEEEEDKPLAGERVSVLEYSDAAASASAEATPEALKSAIEIPEMWKNDFWPQPGGYPSHTMQHVALGTDPLKKSWSTGIGAGATKVAPLTAQPIVVNGAVFTLDTKHVLSAFNAKNGARIWSTETGNPDEDENVLGGGIAFAQDVIYVTNGYNEVLAVNAKDGKILWRVSIPSPARAAPTVVENRIFVSTLDNRLFALDNTGQILWDFSGISETAGLIGAASPAASGEIVVPGFSSGEIFALRVESGAVAWSENLSTLRSSTGLLSITDIRGLPVIDKGIVFAVSFGGKIIAVDARTGARIWSREIGSAETPWIAGDTLYVTSTQSEIVAMDRESGIVRWVSKLPRYESPEKKRDPIFWTGPVLAGGRLIVASSDGRVMEIDPVTGKLTRAWKAEDGVRVAPVVAGETLFLLSDNGTLSAYR